MQQSVTQSLSPVKRQIWHPSAFKLGIADGKAGASWADGYSYFVGPSYTQWRMGWELGRKAARGALGARQMTH